MWPQTTRLLGTLCFAKALNIPGVQNTAFDMPRGRRTTGQVKSEYSKLYLDLACLTWYAP